MINDAVVGQLYAFPTQLPPSKSMAVSKPQNYESSHHYPIPSTIPQKLHADYSNTKSTRSKFARSHSNIDSCYNDNQMVIPETSHGRHIVNRNQHHQAYPASVVENQSILNHNTEINMHYHHDNMQYYSGNRFQAPPPQQQPIPTVYIQPQQSNIHVNTHQAQFEQERYLRNAQHASDRNLSQSVSSLPPSTSLDDDLERALKMSIEDEKNRILRVSRNFFKCIHF